MRPPKNSGRIAAHSVVLWVALVFLPLPAWAQPAVAVPTLTGRVVDLVNSLSSEQKQSLEARLQAFEQRKGSQIAVLIIAKTQPGLSRNCRIGQSPSNSCRLPYLMKNR